MDHDTFDVTLELQHDQQFTADFGLADVPTLAMDEPPPAGQGQGPNASRLLAAAVGNCLSASALFCLRKARINVRGMRTTVTATLRRNELHRMRVTALDAVIQLDVDEQDRPRTARCLEVFEDYCIVTQSVRKGIDVNVQVEAATKAPQHAEDVSAT